MPKTLKSFALFLLLTSCAGRPPVTTFDAQWTFVETPGQPLKACLLENDVAKLRELLIRCESRAP